LILTVIVSLAPHVHAARAGKKVGAKKAEISRKEKISDSLTHQARMAYQQKNYAEAIRLYRAIPESDSRYIPTREELGWAYLQAGQWAPLQGMMRDLNTTVVPISQRLEGRVLSAISELRLCHYQDVQTEIQKFQNEMRAYAKALQAQPNSLAKTNKIKMVQEAILKMKFVRLELLNQLRLVQALNKSGEMTGLGLAADSESPQESASRGSQMDFAVDESFWADEFLNKVSYEESSCASLKKGARL
jgi:tetratricopeptide (TPR) repeat protein